MNKGAVLSKLLRALADAVEALSDDEVEELLSRNGVGPLLSRGRSWPASPKDEKQRPKEAAEALMNSLKSVTSRDAAAAVLEREHPTRAVLVEAAKIRNVHVLKQDTVDVLRIKLIENVVGSRLDSAAIRGDGGDTNG